MRWARVPSLLAGAGSTAPASLLLGYSRNRSGRSSPSGSPLTSIPRCCARTTPSPKAFRPTDKSGRLTQDVLNRNSGTALRFPWQLGSRRLGLGWGRTGLAAGAIIGSGLAAPYYGGSLRSRRTKRAPCRVLLRSFKDSLQNSLEKTGNLLATTNASLSFVSSAIF